MAGHARVEAFILLDPDLYPVCSLDFEHLRRRTDAFLFDGPDITIAFGPTGLNMSRLLEPIVKCFANRSYAFREGYFVNVVPFPESIQQLLPAHDAFAVFDQVNKHLKRPVGQVDLGTTA